MHWQPTATLPVLKASAALKKRVRDFFYERDVLEVDTPALAKFTVTDPHIESIEVCYQAGSVNPERYYLQTSPEYAMKRLLAAGSPAIYQLSKAYRRGEVGRLHNPEFTMLEWYRPGWDHVALMAEVEELLQLIFPHCLPERKTYQAVFEHYTGLNPHTLSLCQLKHLVKTKHLAFDADELSTMLDFVFSHLVEPFLGWEQPLFIYDYPIFAAGLAQIRRDTTPFVASRFEVYVKGLELANGFHELVEPIEQYARFKTDIAQRIALGLSPVEMDTRFLAALEQGLPPVAGVALGFDRLLLLLTQKQNLAEVISFGFERA